MNSYNIPAQGNPQILKGFLTVVFSCCLFPICALSQSAYTFDNEGVEAPRVDNALKKDSLTPDSPELLPSRFAGDDVEPYIASRLASFSMANRPIDPFGLNQDTSVKPAAKVTPAQLRPRSEPGRPATPLADVVKLIDITLINTRERKFLVGNQSFVEGGQFEVGYQGKKILMKVLKVTAGEIVFQDVNTGEKTTRASNVLPAGMIPGGKKMKPEGMVDPNASSPLILDR